MRSRTVAFHGLSFCLARAMSAAIGSIPPCHPRVSGHGSEPRGARSIAGWTHDVAKRLGTALHDEDASKVTDARAQSEIFRKARWPPRRSSSTPTAVRPSKTSMRTHAGGSSATPDDTEPFGSWLVSITRPGIDLDEALAALRSATVRAASSSNVRCSCSIPTCCRERLHDALRRRRRHFLRSQWRVVECCEPQRCPDPLSDRVQLLSASNIAKLAPLERVLRSEPCCVARWPCGHWRSRHAAPASTNRRPLRPKRSPVLPRDPLPRRLRRQHRLLAPPNAPARGQSPRPRVTQSKSIVTPAHET